MSRRNSSIDLIKFVFCLVILLYHAGFLFPGGYLAVEGFFLISGYLMMNSAKKDGAEVSVGRKTFRFVARKYAAVFPYLLGGAVIGAVLYVRAGLLPSPKDGILAFVLSLFPEVFPLQVLGFSGSFTTGVSWYLSAMFFAMAILYPIAVTKPETFAFGVCPVLSLALYGMLTARMGHLDVPCTFLFGGLVNTGVLRAAAGLSAGALLYGLLHRGEEKEPTLLASSLYTAAEVLLLAALGYLIRTYARTSLDFPAVFLLFLLLYIVIGRKSLIARFLPQRVCAALATASSVLFLNHYYWVLYLHHVHPEYAGRTFLLQFTVRTALSAGAVFLLAWLFRLILKTVKQKRAEKAESAKA